MLAARGARNLDSGEEKIAGEAAASALRRTAGKIHAASLAAALILTLAALLISGAF